MPLARSLSRMPDAHADLDDAREGAELVTPDGRSLPLVGARLVAEAAGGLARVVLEQTFANRHDEALRVTYRMPLPADGAVSGYEFRVGERTVRGSVAPTEEARARFEAAIVAGKTAGLLEQQRADIFTQELGNLPPRATLVARVTIDQPLAWLAEGQWEWRFPTVIGPRYIGSGETAADAAAVRIAVAERTDARVHLELRVRDELAAGRVVESPSHRLARADEGFTLATPAGARLDRDVVVRWAVAGPDVGVALAVARPPASAPHAGCAYGLLTIVPPAPEVRPQAFARDLIVLLDTSGSMDGAPLAAAKRVVAALIDALTEEDRLEVIEFSSSARAWRRGPAPATAEARADAIGWVQARRAGGGTEMYAAVKDALRQLRPHAQRQVVLVTDGYIGGEQQLVDLCHERLPTGCRLHFVGVGAAVNRSLATALARAGRGAEVLVGPTEDVEPPTRRLLDRTCAPVLTEVSVSGDAVVELAPEHVPDVFAGAPVRVAVKLSASGGEVVVRGELAGGTWERRVMVAPVRPGAGDPGVVALFAREHVADLETRWTIGREAQQIDRAIEKVGVVFQIATRHTAWVAIDEEPGVDPRRGSLHVVQPQELPDGTSVASFGLAAPAPAPVPARRVSALTGSRSPDSVLFSLDSLSSMAVGSGAPRGAKTVIQTGAKKQAPPEPTRGPAKDEPAAPAGSGEVLYNLDALDPTRRRRYSVITLAAWDDDAPAGTRDDAVREAYYAEVFAEFIAKKLQNGENIETFTLERFAYRLRATTAELMAQPGVVDVQFVVYLKDGKIAVKGRVVRDESVRTPEPQRSPARVSTGEPDLLALARSGHAASEEAPSEAPSLPAVAPASATEPAWTRTAKPWIWAGVVLVLAALGLYFLT